MDADTVATLHAYIQSPAPRGYVRAPDGAVLPWTWINDKRVQCPVPGCGLLRSSVGLMKAHVLEKHGWSSCGAYTCTCAVCENVVLFADVAHAAAFHGKATFSKDWLRPTLCRR